MIFKLPSRRVMTIEIDQLEDSPREGLERLAKFVGIQVDPNWDKETLARKVFWEINPPPTASMY